MAEQTANFREKSERALGFLRNIHLAIAIGAAVVGASVIAGYEFLNAGVHEAGRQVIKPRQAKKVGHTALVGSG